MRPVEERARQKLVDQGGHDNDLVIVQRAVVRHRGSSSGLEVVFRNTEELRPLFEEAYHKNYGFSLPDKDIVVESVAIEAAGSHRHSSDTKFAGADGASTPLRPVSRTELYFNNAMHEVPVYQLDDVAVGAVLSGPATTVVDVDWQAFHKDVFAHDDLYRLLTTAKSCGTFTVGFIARPAGRCFSVTWATRSGESASSSSQCYSWGFEQSASGSFRLMNKSASLP